VQREPSVVASSHQEKHHHSPPSVAIHIGEHRGGLSQHTKTAEVGLPTDLIRVLEGSPQTSSLAYTVGLWVQRESSNPQGHVLGTRPQGNSNQCPGLLLVIPPGPPHSSTIRGGSRATDQGYFDLFGMGGSNVVASADQTEDRYGSNLSASCSGLPQVSQGGVVELPVLDPLYAFHINGKVV